MRMLRCVRSLALLACLHVCWVWRTRVHALCYVVFVPFLSRSSVACFPCLPPSRFFLSSFSLLLFLLFPSAPFPALSFLSLVWCFFPVSCSFALSVVRSYVYVY